MVEDINNEKLEIIKSILNSRQLVLGWTDTKAQNLITASSILMAVIGVLIVTIQPTQLSMVMKVLLIISGLSTVITLSLSLFVTKFRLANQTNLQPRANVVSIFGTYTFLQENKGSQHNLMEKFKEQLLSIGKSPLDYYSEVILLNTYMTPLQKGLDKKGQNLI